VYEADEAYLNALKTLVQEADLRKQWMGFFLISTTLDPALCIMNENNFNKVLNILIHAISNAVNKNEVLTD